VSISRIPDPDFVFCNECRFCVTKRGFRTGRIETYKYCKRREARLHGQQGCDKGQKRKTAPPGRQTTLEMGDAP
jgi:hypothetical protein